MYLVGTWVKLGGFTPRHCFRGDRPSFFKPLRDRLKPFKWRFGDLDELPHQCVSTRDGQILEYEAGSPLVLGLPPPEGLRRIAVLSVLSVDFFMVRGTQQQQLVPACGWIRTDRSPPDMRCAARASRRTGSRTGRDAANDRPVMTASRNRGGGQAEGGNEQGPRLAMHAAAG
jgi:hypothetical protein